MTTGSGTRRLIALLIMLLAGIALASFIPLLLAIFFDLRIF